MYSNGIISNSQPETRISVSDILSSMNAGQLESSVITTFSNLDGLTTGVPTRTTPTLTPTTLKNIEESFMEMQSVPPAPLQHQHQAGFVPPVIGGNNNYSLKEEPQEWMNASCLSPTSSITSSTSSSSPALISAPHKSNRGGRRPNKIEKLSPEEEERRRVRRERNKLAAARCRKRRLDHTNLLLQETEGLEEQRNMLEREVNQLAIEKRNLELVLEAHRSSCKVRGIHNPPSNLPPAYESKLDNGLYSFDMEGSVVTSSCSGQQRNSDPSDMGNNDAKLVSL